MAIKDSKICNFFPLSAVIRPRQVENNRDSVFIIIPDRSLIGRRRICLNISIRLETMLRRLKVGDGRQYLGQWRIGIFTDSNIPASYILNFWIEINFFPDNLIRLSDRRFGLGPWLILICILCVLWMRLRCYLYSLVGGGVILFRILWWLDCVVVFTVEEVLAVRGVL